MAVNLPPVPLNRQPLGLLDLLAIKNGGLYPQTLAPELSGSLELLPLYEASAPPVYGTATGNLVGGITLVGPSAITDLGATYHFHQFGVRIDCTAAAAVAYVEIGLCPNSTTLIPLAATFVAAQAIASFPQHASAVARDVWVPAGFVLGFRCFGLVGAANPYVASWLATAYRQ